jgi:hypothetical protein
VTELTADRPAAETQMLKLAFYGRVSTEDQQDPESSRAWQLHRSQQLIEPTAASSLPSTSTVATAAHCPGNGALPPAAYWRRSATPTAALLVS